ncbi:uncharacterized protein LOC129774604 [Toxorhynchites rutilus septentrionalis]|uniref:uncharacterized protein LOC129774604 n=1 Tax=Toxorhynchites rutilus septentrionalis TaxID=329112 RepID=UPI00247954DF|nr:uncharacterized protein LOC129774604 [Toxorhynchites rutilus septentrionalis]
MGVRNLVEHMILANQRQHVSNPMLLLEMVDRFPPILKLQWASFHTVDLETFNHFMTDLVTMANEGTLNTDLSYESAVRSEKNKKEKLAKEKLFIHQQASSTYRPEVSRPQQKETVNIISRPCSHCESTEHRIAVYPEFIKLDVDKRWKVMKLKGLCRICLMPHRSWPCRSKKECGVGDCRRRHHHLLLSRTTELGTLTPSTSFSNSVAHQHHYSITSSALLRYLPVTLFANGKRVNVYAFLDDGSLSTMMEAEVSDPLELKDLGSRLISVGRETSRE